MLEAYAERWALITGASSGIGAAFARKLAARGMHLILTARRSELMEQLAEDLYTRHGTKSEIIPADLSDPAQVETFYAEVQTRGLRVDLLVNNAGFTIVGEVDEAETEQVLAMLRLNVEALTALTYRFLPEMLARRQGAIINVSSIAAFQPIAYMGAYSASKAYILHFSEALWAEVYERGVTVMALCPGVTQTPFFEVAGAGGWLKKRRAQSPEFVVKKALKALDKRRQYVIPSWKDYLLPLIVRLTSRRRIVRESRKYFRPRQKDKKRKKDTGDHAR